MEKLSGHLTFVNIPRSGLSSFSYLVVVDTYKSITRQSNQYEWFLMQGRSDIYFYLPPTYPTTHLRRFYL